MNLRIFFLPIIYFSALLLSGVLMDTLLVIPVQSRLYPLLKIAHRNLFFYGFYLNLFPAIVFYLGKNRPYPEKFFRVFRAYQVGIIAAILSVFLGNFQALPYAEFEWVFDVFFFFYFAALLWVMFTEKPIEKSAREVWILYIFFPFLFYYGYFIFLNAARPLGPLSSAGIYSVFFTNVLQAGFDFFLVHFLLPVPVFGILFLLVISRSPRPEMIRPMRVQWVLHLMTSSLSLYVYFGYMENRLLLPWKEAVLMAIYVPFFAGLINLNALKESLEEEWLKKILPSFGLLIQIYVWGQVIGEFHGFRELFIATSWFTAQKHVLTAGLVAGVFFILFYNDVSKKQMISEFWKSVWFYCLIAFGIFHWIMGAVEAGLWNKETPYRFLEYPSWIAVENAIGGFRWIEVMLDLVFIYFFAYFIKKELRNAQHAKS